MNYPSENDAVMESLTGEKIIQGIMDTPTDDDHDLDDNCVLLNVPKKAFQAIVTLNNYLLQHEKNEPYVVHALQKN